MNDAMTDLSVASGVDATVAARADATAASGADAAVSNAQAPRKVARKGLRGRFDALPTRQRWLVAGTLAVLGWLVADELLWAPARAWAAESERIEQALDRGARRESTVTTDLRRSVATFGPVAPPARRRTAARSWRAPSTTSCGSTRWAGTATRPAPGSA